MEPTTEQILKVLYQIDETMVWVGIKLLIGAVIILVLKSITENIAGYIMFRIDRHVGIGTPVEVYGKKGRIKDVSWYEVSIETDCGYIRIPPKYWRISKYMILKDELILRNRRILDIQNIRVNDED